MLITPISPKMMVRPNAISINTVKIDSPVKDCMTMASNDM